MTLHKPTVQVKSISLYRQKTTTIWSSMGETGDNLLTFQLGMYFFPWKASMPIMDKNFFRYVSFLRFIRKWQLNESMLLTSLWNWRNIKTKNLIFGKTRLWVASESDDHSSNVWIHNVCCLWNVSGTKVHWRKKYFVYVISGNRVRKSIC